MDIKLLTPPDRFVGLHGHTSFSVFDGLGYPDQHIDFVLENGMDAWGMTDHGNGSGLAHAHKHATKIQKSGRKYRQIYGCEFYFVPSLNDWKTDYEQSKIEDKPKVIGNNVMETILQEGPDFIRNESKRESQFEKMNDREMMVQTNLNPFITSNYLEDLQVQEKYLTPQNSNS